VRLGPAGEQFVRVLKVAEDRVGRVVCFSPVPAKSGARVPVHVYAYDGHRPVGQLLTGMG
jgi:hypothetical protein